MLKILDPRETDQLVYGGVFDEMFAVSGSTNICWNYLLDYAFVLSCFGRWMKRQIGIPLRVLDIGCGPGVLHYFLEYHYDLDIVGIDRKDKWKGPAPVNVVGDFCDVSVRNKAGVDGQNIDAILAISAFEYNDFEKHKEVVQICRDCLRPGGILISTVSTHPNSTKGEEQWNLNQKQLEEIYGEPFRCYNYGYMLGVWRKHYRLCNLYRNRYQGQEPFHFLTVGGVVGSCC